MIPDYLKEFDQWVVWKNDGGKRPYAPWTHVRHPVDPLDPGNWTSYEQAVRLVKYREFEGLGFVFTEDDDVVGVDLDDGVERVDTSGGKVELELRDEHRQIVDALNSFTEISQSGTGLHVFVRGEVGGQVVDKDAEVEVYDRGRFFSMTGKHVPKFGLEVEKRQSDLDRLKKRYGDGTVELPESRSSYSRRFDPSVYEPSSESEFDRLTVSDVFPDYEAPTKREHPVHGSSTGENFAVPGEDGFVGTCFRASCSVGGSQGCLLRPHHLLAMELKGWEKCSKAREEWCLDLRIEVWKYAVEEYGVDPFEVPLSIKRGLAERFGVDPFAGGKESVVINRFLKRKLKQEYGVTWFDV